MLKNVAAEKLGNEQAAASIELLWDLYVTVVCSICDSDSVTATYGFT